MTTYRDMQEDKKSKRAAKKEQRARGRQLKQPANLGELDWRRVAALCIVMARHDGAVRIGVTRDGGAIAFGMYRGDDYATEYIRPNEDTAKSLDEIAAAWLEEELAEYAEICIGMGIP